MPSDGDTDAPEPTRESVDGLSGASVIEFGADWCGHCQGAEPAIAAALSQFTGVRHIKVEDGPGRPLGRSFRVKLWPTLVFLKDGKEEGRVVRPTGVEEIRRALEAIAR